MQFVQTLSRPTITAARCTQYIYMLNCFIYLTYTYYYNCLPHINSICCVYYAHERFRLNGQIGTIQ